MQDTFPTASGSDSEPDEVLDLVASVLQMNPAELSEDDGMETLAQWDSLKVILLASMIEVTFGITLAGDEIEKLTSIRSVRQVIDLHGGR
jgi:acyl carrier protein